MGLEQIKHCNITKRRDSLIITGLCKRCNKKYTVMLTTTQYEEWKGGMPLKYVAANLPCSAITFLTTGVWTCQK